MQYYYVQLLLYVILRNITTVYPSLVGLLANLWEFPSIPLVVGEETTRKEEVMVVKKELEKEYGLTSTQTDSLTYSADVVHIFSHIHQTYRYKKKRDCIVLSYVCYCTKYKHHILCACNTVYFSIIRVYQVSLTDSQGLAWPDRYQGSQWMDKTEFFASATSTAMKKVKF